MRQGPGTWGKGKVRGRLSWSARTAGLSGVEQAGYGLSEVGVRSERGCAGGGGGGGSGGGAGEGDGDG